MSLLLLIIPLMVFGFDPPPYRRGNIVTVGSSQSGKTHATILRTLAAALSEACAIVVIDPHHRSLAHRLFELLVAYALEDRVLFDRLSDFDRVLQYRFLHPPVVSNAHERAALIDLSARHFIDILGRRRDIASLAKHPQTEECTYLALLLILHQRSPQAATRLRFAFHPHADELRELIDGCTEGDVRQYFVKVQSGAIKPAVYASAKRLIDAVAGSPLLAVRCSEEPSFDLHAFLDDLGILLVEGGGRATSRDGQSTVLGTVVLNVLDYIRTRGYRGHRVLLVLDEATNAQLVSYHEALALNELQKDVYGLDIHIIVQTPSFPSSEIYDAVFQNCQRHEWFYCANNAVAQLGASDLGDPELRQQLQKLRRGERYVNDHGQTFFEQVPAMPDPWVLPGLAADKAAEALAEIHKRSEYRKPSCPASTSTRPVSETKSSSTAPPDTSSPRGTFEISSPAMRLATGDSQNSGNEES